MSFCNDIKNSVKNVTRGARSKLGGLLVEDWTTLPDGTVYYDAELKSYCSVVQLPYESPGDNESQVQQRLNEAALPGFRNIIQHYNREGSDPSIVQISGWHVPERPNPNGCVVFGLKVLVCIPEEALESLSKKESSRQSNNQSNSQSRRINNTGQNIPSQESNTPDEFVKASRELTFLTSDFKQDLEDIKDLFDVYAEEVENFKGTVQGVDLRREGQKLIQFGNAVDRLFQANGELFRQEEDDLFIIGVENNQVKYVLLDKEKGPINLTTNIDQFLSNVSVQSDRTVNYISQIDAIKSDESEWDAFITKFTLRPPTIIPGESRANREEAKVKSTVSAEESTRIINVADEKSVKSATDVKKEDTSILDPEVKKTLTLLEETKDAFVGDSVFNDLDQALDDIESLEQAYGAFLNKIGLRSLVQRAIKCVTDQIPLEEIQAALELAKKLAALKAIPCELFVDLLFNKLDIDLNQIEALQQAFVNEVTGCVSSLAEEEKQALFADVSNRSGVPVSTLDELVEVDIGISIEGFGLNTDNIKKAICDKARGAIVDSLPDLDVNLDINFADLGIEINLPDIDLDQIIPEFKPPTVNLPDNLPTADIMAAIGEQLEQALIDALTTALVGLIKGLLEDIVNNCGDLSKVDFGVADLEQALANSLGQLRDSPAVRNAKQALLDSLKLSVDLGNLPEILNSLDGLLNDLSAVLTSAEITLLLNGRPTLTTRQVIACLTDQKYPSLSFAFDNVSKIEQFFQTLGQSLDKEILLEQIASTQTPLRSPIKNICDVPNDEPRRRILESKGLTPEQVEEQVNNAKTRKLGRLRNLAKLLDNDNVLEGVLPPVFCDATSDGLIPRDPPSLTFMLDRTIDTVYDGVHMAFNQDISGFVSAITEQASTDEIARKVERKKEVTLEDGSTSEYRNPEFTRLISQGVSVENPEDDDGDPITVFEEDALSGKLGNSFVARGLRQNLLSVEVDRNLVSVGNSEISFAIPSAITKEIVKRDIPSDLLPINISDLTGALGSVAITEYNINYKLEPGQTDDTYTLEVQSKNADDSTNILFAFSQSNPVTSSIQNFVDQEGLVLLQNKPPQESYFADLMAKTWSRGSNIYVNGIKQPRPDYAKGIGNEVTNSTLFGSFRREFAGSQFYEMFRDILSLITKQASRSPLFRSDVISLIDWTPERVENGCDPHLLDLQSIKKQMKDDYENAACDDSFMPSTDGLGRAQLNPLEQTGISGAVLTTLRLYVIEALLKAIFFFSEFKISDITQVDDMVSEFITQELDRNIQQLSSEYAEQFRREAILVHNDLINKQKISGDITTDSDVAIATLLNEQIKSVMERLSQMIGSKGDLDIDNVLLEEWLPLFDLPNQSEPRFAEQGVLGIRPVTNNERKDNYRTTFSTKNGNFILERYIRVEDASNSPFLGNPINNPRADELFGIVNIERFNSFLSSFPESESINNGFRGMTYGLRVSYVPPIETEDFNTNNQRQRIFNNILIAADNVGASRVQNKAFDVTEQVALASGLQTRQVAVTPLVSVELPVNLGEITTQTDLVQKWEEQFETLRDMLKETAEYKLLFDFCFPLERILSLGIIYSSTYLSQLDPVRGLFDTTKQSLCSLFGTLTNVGNYTYEDKLNPPGANANNLTNSLNNISNKFNIPGISLLAIAARTPFLILKGLVEATDSNISNAKKIVDGAKDQGVKIPMVAASLGQLPMNVFPPTPFGPGIGPPITPFGFTYLATDMDGIFNSAKGKDVNRQNLSAETNLDFDTLKDKCEENNE